MLLIVCLLDDWLTIEDTSEMCLEQNMDLITPTLSTLMAISSSLYTILNFEAPNWEF